MSKSPFYRRVVVVALTVNCLSISQAQNICRDTSAPRRPEILTPLEFDDYLAPMACPIERDIDDECFLDPTLEQCRKACEEDPTKPFCLPGTCRDFPNCDEDSP